jgi:hypothetical protein
MCRILIGLVLALAALPVWAQTDMTCDGYRRYYVLFEAELKAAVREHDRVMALKPEPVTDVALCRAFRKFVFDSPYFIESHRADCWQNDKTARAYQDRVKGLADSASKLAGSYCSDAEKRRPVKSGVWPENTK